MKNLLFNSLLIFSVILTVSCSYRNQANSDGASEDTVTLPTADTNHTTAPDTIQSSSGKSDPVQAIQQKVEPVQAVSAKGDSAVAGSTRMESTNPGTTTKHPGAIKNPGANQSETDSIKKTKTKGKKRD